MLFLSNKAGEIPLHIAARNGDHEIVEALLHWPKSRHRGGQHLVEDMLKKTNGEGGTALHLAARFDQREVVEILSRAGPNVSYGPNHSGRTPIFFAAERGHLCNARTEKALAQHKDAQGWTAFVTSQDPFHRNTILSALGPPALTVLFPAAQEQLPSRSPILGLLSHHHA
ncbi:hypothetical protein ACLB2K_018161 [Fragaria x ananassa]